MVAKVIASSPDETQLIHSQHLAKASQGVTGKQEVNSVRKIVAGVGYAGEYPYSGTE
jgi:hypothetical protein